MILNHTNWNRSLDKLREMVKKEIGAKDDYYRGGEFYYTFQTDESSYPQNAKELAYKLMDIECNFEFNTFDHAVIIRVDVYELDKLLGTNDLA